MTELQVRTEEARTSVPQELGAHSPGRALCVSIDSKEKAEDLSGERVTSGTRRTS